MGKSASPPIAAPLGDAVTDRLRLSRFTAGDADVLAPVFAVRAVWEYPFGRAMSATWTAGFVARAAEHWERFGFGLWVVRRLRDEEAIGYLGLSMPSFLSELVPAERMPAVEVGWRLHPAHWGHGYATEGALMALKGAFETLKLREVCSAPQNTNLLSARVAERIAMRYERTAALSATADRGAVEVDLYWITQNEWLGRL
jgi:RimJ/RimL family protein N-acetyltransferase